MPEVAARLRVSRTAVYGWRKRWRAGGERALASKGPGGSRCRLDEGRLRRLADALEQGPPAHGFGADQRRTLAPGGRTSAAQRQAWLVFEDEAGQTPRPPKARTWGRRGHTPVVPVPGKGSGRVSIAGLNFYRPGQRSQLIDRTITHRGRKNERRSFSERDHIALLDAAHQQLDGPIVLIWDNLNTHISAAMRQTIDARDWLTVIRLPAHAPDLNPTEAVWSHLKHVAATLLPQHLPPKAVKRMT